MPENTEMTLDDIFVAFGIIVIIFSILTRFLIIDMSSFAGTVPTRPIILLPAISRVDLV
tara:strand:- start:369 stop:545 length:177 start_codon:yes stop_codon:yes gene_type:complete